MTSTVYEVLTAAFHDDPVVGWLFPDPVERRRLQQYYYGGLLRQPGAEVDVAGPNASDAAAGGASAAVAATRLARPADRGAFDEPSGGTGEPGPPAASGAGAGGDSAIAADAGASAGAAAAADRAAAVATGVGPAIGPAIGPITGPVTDPVTDPATDPATGDAAGDAAGVAVWLALPAGRRPFDEPSGATGGPEALAVFGASAGRLMTLGAVLAERHPHHEAHRYLACVGVLPHRRGEGLGTSLLRQGLARADADRVPAYLEASSSRNRDLYLRHGFEDLGEPIQLPDGPQAWPMWRPQPR